MSDREERGKDWDVIRELFLMKRENRAELYPVAPHLHFPHNLVLVDIRKSFNRRFGQYIAKVWVAGGLASVRSIEGDNVLTEIIFSVFRLSQFGCQRFQAVFARLEKADALHVRHTIAFPVVYSVCQVHLMR